jgi:hypothetical protein
MFKRAPPRKRVGTRSDGAFFFFLDLEKEETASIYIIDPRGRQMVKTSKFLPSNKTGIQ